LLHQSITEIKEQELIAFLLKDLYFRNRVLNIEGLEAEDAVMWKEYRSADFAKSCRATVDILVVPKGHPEQSTAIQAKRYQVEIESDDADYTKQIRHMADLFRKGVRQANDNADLGFWQVYLWVLVVIDSRKRNAGRLTYEGADSLLSSLIRSTISTEHCARVWVCSTSNSCRRKMARRSPWIRAMWVGSVPDRPRHSQKN
jgi:hypothetical protein